MLKNIKWYGDESDKLICYADHKKTPIRFWFDNEEVSLISVDQTEFEPTEESLFDLFVCVDGDLVSLYELMLKAQSDYPDILEEFLANEAAEDDHRAYISSPQATGRI